MKYLIIPVILILFQSCANQTAPMGGPRDETPPTLISSSPEDQEINVSTDEIKLTFDEYLKLNKPKEQIIISPRIDKEVEYTSRKNTVLIKFEDTLPDSTTFTINFRDGIQDITEGNSPNDLKLAFSTGEYLDSLYITGEVYDLFTNRLVKNYALFLYNHKDTLTIFEDSPLYFSKTTDKGAFTLENIKPGYYDLYAVHDKNKNLRLDLETEAYSFIDSTLVLRDTVVNNITLYSYLLNALPIELRSARQNGTIFELKYNKYITSYQYTYEDTAPLFSTFLDEEHKSIIFYKPQNYVDSLLTYVTVTDSLNYNRKDTLYINFEDTDRRSRKLEDRVTLDQVFPSNGLLKGNITFNKPINRFNSDSLYLFLDSANIITIDTSNYLTVNDKNDEFSLHYTIDPSLFITPDQSKAQSPTKTDKSISTDATSTDSTKQSKIPPPKPHIYIGRGAFISIDNDSVKSQIIDLKFAKKENYATLFIDIESEDSSFLIQLTDSKYNTLQEVTNQPKFSFNNISPGEYYIRIIRDTNNNGRWDPGDIYTRTLPEPILIYESAEGTREIVLRANWETPITLIF